MIKHNKQQLKSNKTKQNKNSTKKNKTQTVNIGDIITMGEKRKPNTKKIRVKNRNRPQQLVLNC